MLLHGQIEPEIEIERSKVNERERAKLEWRDPLQAKAGPRGKRKRRAKRKEDYNRRARRPN